MSSSLDFLFGLIKDLVLWLYHTLNPSPKVKEKREIEKQEKKTGVKVTKQEQMNFGFSPDDTDEVYFDKIYLGYTRVQGQKSQDALKAFYEKQKNTPKPADRWAAGGDGEITDAEVTYL